MRRRSLIKSVQSCAARCGPDARITVYSILLLMTNSLLSNAEEVTAPASVGAGASAVNEACGANFDLVEIVGALSATLADADLEANLRVRLLQLLVLCFKGRSQMETADGLADAIVPSLLNLTGTLPPNDDSTVLCVRLLGQLLPVTAPAMAKDGTSDGSANGESPAASFIGNLLARLGRTVWPSGIKGGEAAEQAGWYSSKTVPSTGHAQRLSAVAKRRMYWGSPPRVLSQSRCPGLLIRLPEQERSIGTPAAGGTEACARRVLRVPLPLGWTAGAMRLQARKLVTADFVRPHELLTQLEEGTANAMASAHANMQPTGLRVVDDGRAVDVDVQGHTVAVHIFFAEGDAGSVVAAAADSAAPLLWTYVPMASAANDVASGFCKEWHGDGVTIDSSGDVATFRGDSTCVSAQGFTAHTGTWTAEFCIDPQDLLSRGFHPDGAYIGLWWTCLRTPVAERNRSEVRCLPHRLGKSPDSWGWLANGRSYFQGNEASILPWTTGDTLTLTLDTKTMTLTPAKRTSQGIEEALAPIQLPADILRDDIQVHFACSRYFGTFSVKLVSVRRAASAPGLLIARPTTIHNSLHSKSGSAPHGMQAGSKAALQLEEPLACEVLTVPSADAIEAQQHAEIALLRQLMCADVPSGQVREARQILDSALRSAALDVATPKDVELALGALYAIGAREDVVRRGAQGWADDPADSAIPLATTQRLCVLTADSSQASVARLVSTLAGKTEIIVGTEPQSRLRLELRWPPLPDSAALLATIGDLISFHLRRSGVTDPREATSHMSLALTTLSAMAVETLCAFSSRTRDSTERHFWILTPPFPFSPFYCPP